MHALRQELVPASGVEFITSLKLTPASLENLPVRHELAARVLCNVVVARSNLLRIFAVYDEPATMLGHMDEERDRKAQVRKGTEAVEGEVQMEELGDGFINLGKSASQKPTTSPPTVTRLHFVREHRVHGIITGLEGVKTVASQYDKLDRLVVSFKDAKIALLEWSDSVHDLVTVSIHTYERASQLMSVDSTTFRALLRSESLSRCVALLLPKDSIAILPFNHAQADLEAMDQDQNLPKDIPYAPSFILDLPASINEDVRNIIDFVFLEGFSKPTMAVLYQTTQTWTGRLNEHKDTVGVVMFTMDLGSQSYSIIVSQSGLPSDSFTLLPCAPTLGGVIVLTGNSILYIDKASRLALPVNGWASRVTDMAMTAQDNVERGLHLEGSRSVFVDDRTFLIVLRDGTVYPVELIVEGKTVSKLALGTALAQTTVPAVARRMDDGLVLIGSTAGASVLLKASHMEEEIKDGQDMDSSPTAVVDTNDAMDFDEDDDIYGPSTSNTGPATRETTGANATKQTRMVLHLALADSLPATGPISDIAFSLTKNGERHVPELVATTGAGHLGGFTLFQRDLPARTKRKLHAIGGARGVWSLPIRQPVKANGISYERPANPFHTENDTLIISTDATPPPGLSRIATRSSKGDIQITVRIPVGTTIGAGPFFQRTAILHVMSNSIRVLEPDGSERQIIKDVDGNTPRPKIKACSISDPFVFILREDETIGLFIGETERGKIRRKDMSAMGDKTSRYVAGCFYTDVSGLLASQIHAVTSNGTNGADKKATTTLQAAVNAGSHSQWLVLVRPQGTMEIWALPKLALVFSTPGLSALEDVLADTYDRPALSLPQDPPRKPQDLDIDQLLVAPLGETKPRPHLFVLLRSGHLAVYELVPSPPPSGEIPHHRSSNLHVNFVKVISKAYDIQRTDEFEKGPLAEQKRISRVFVPFSTTPPNGVPLQGVFFTGDRPSWIMAMDKNAVQIYPSGHSVVHSFTACSLWESKGEFLMYTEEGPSLVEWLPDYQLGGPLPMRSIPAGRAYSNIVFDPSTSLVVAASSLQAKFASFDEDGNCLWEPDGPGITEPVCECSALELISPELWITMDGYEFATNESVNSIACVTLETVSTESGTKDFIAVGTTIDRGEDLAVKGATYIFEIVEVVPDPALAPKRWYKLRLRCKDEAKGPVTAVCGINGYLVSSMGQKIFVRALDLDERLVGIAFLDVGVYVTTLRSLKNLLLIGDAVKSVWFVAFQEDPYKLVVLAKDINQICVTRSDFFFAEEELSIITCDEEGVVRMYEYNPNDPESRDGRHLLLDTEFHGQVDYRASALFAWRTKEDPILPRSKLICGECSS
ncbi:hypothetical protein HGRIS_000094 [Hohenbuehelia grisea]|uniref:DNA damage-binding protein 1 n=1 Tax=Hohenbuehelia grisea TaxID=104357 RepID=A0ABR3JRZ5_9AGAR